MAYSIHPLHLADLELPEFHPSAGSACAVYAFAIEHPSGAILVDTGVGEGGKGGDWIDRHYAPRRRSLTRALEEVGIAVAEVAAVVHTHLHFDHCGNDRLFPGVPLFVQESEHEAARSPRYTVRDWLDFPGAQWRPVHGELEVADGVTLLPTPGHTPGHQSVLVEDERGLDLICGQAAYNLAEFARGAVEAEAAVGYEEAYERSQDRLRALGADAVRFSHDARVWRP